MTSTTRTLITATPLYPGLLFPNEGTTVEISDPSLTTALSAVDDDGAWFCIEVAQVPQRRWTADDGQLERWLADGPATTHRIYVGEQFTSAEVASWPGDTYITLLNNMKGNDWPTIVRTRRGNWQPPSAADVVLSQAELAAARS